MRKYVIFAISIILIIVSVVFASTDNNMETIGRELTREEQQQVSEAVEVVKDIANFELPNIKEIFAQARLNKTHGSTEDAENLSRISSTTLAFKIDYKVDINAKVFNEQVNGTINMYCKGECKLTKDAILLDYQECRMSGEINMSYPFKVYLGKGTVMIYVYDGSNAWNMYSIKKNKWLNIYDISNGDEICDILEDSIEAYNNALFGELSYYGDFFEENNSTSFVSLNGKYVLNSSMYTSFAMGFAENDINGKSDIPMISDEFDGINYDFRKLNGSFAMDLSKDDEIGISHSMNWNYNVSFDESNIEYSGYNITYNQIGNVEYKIFDIDKTVLVKPSI